MMEDENYLMASNYDGMVSDSRACQALSQPAKQLLSPLGQGSCHPFWCICVCVAARNGYSTSSMVILHPGYFPAFPLLHTISSVTKRIMKAFNHQNQSITKLFWQINITLTSYKNLYLIIVHRNNNSGEIFLTMRTIVKLLE